MSRRARRGWISRKTLGLALCLTLLGAAASVGLSGCSVLHDAGTWNDPHNPVAGSGAKGAAPLPKSTAGPAGPGQAAGGPGADASTAPPFDMTPLLHPAKKYLGLEMADAPTSIAPAKQFASWVGGKPDLIGQYLAWGTSFDSQAAQNAWSYGAMDFVIWEPWNTSLAQIAAGASDQYVSAFAQAVRALNVPIALSFGHEFNGDWYPWGTTGGTPAQFVAAWQHIHDLFAQAGATNVIWIWDPNDIWPVPTVQLKPYYPGDAYVDWVGITGYWSEGGPHTYSSLYLPTLLEVRQFTQKPFIIAETAVANDADESQSLTDLFQAVEQHSDILGFVWYDYDKGGDWRIENRPTLQAQFQSELGAGGFAVNGLS